MGPQGPRGAQGPMGVTGPADTITIRYTALVGPNEPALVTDVAGGPNHVLDFDIPRGAVGATGARGPAGAVGPTGAQGVRGPTGAQGIPGAAGARGPAGTPGATGSAGPIGPQGPIGPTGAAGVAAVSAECACIQQMRSVLQQIIQLYPTDTIVVMMESGSSASGRPGALLPAPNTTSGSGLLQLVDAQGAVLEAVPLRKIVSVRIAGAVYHSDITYLPAPAPVLAGADTDCETAVRAYLPVGTARAMIQTGGQTVAQGTVLRNEFGMLVLVGPDNSDPTFVSACGAEILTK